MIGETSDSCTCAFEGHGSFYNVKSSPWGSEPAALGSLQPPLLQRKENPSVRSMLLANTILVENLLDSLDQEGLILPLWKKEISAGKTSFQGAMTELDKGIKVRRFPSLLLHPHPHTLTLHSTPHLRDPLSKLQQSCSSPPESSLSSSPALPWLAPTAPTRLALSALPTAAALSVAATTTTW